MFTRNFCVNCVDFLVFIARQQCSEGFTGGAVVKNPQANAGDTGDLGSIPGLGRSSGVGNGNPLQFCCPENPMDREAWQATVHGVTESWTQLSAHTHTPILLRGFCYLPAHKWSWQFNFVARWVGHDAVRNSGAARWNKGSFRKYCLREGTQALL